MALIQNIILRMTRSGFKGDAPLDITTKDYHLNLKLGSGTCIVSSKTISMQAKMCSALKSLMAGTITVTKKKQ